MKYTNFIMKLAGTAAVVGILCAYQNVAAERAAQVAAREAEIAEVEAYNSEILAQAKAAEENYVYADGTYTGEGQGYGGTISVTVIVEKGKIRSVSIDSSEGEDEEYFSLAESLTGTVVKDQSADNLDTVSGATASSQGLIDAVNHALAQAKEA